MREKTKFRDSIDCGLFSLEIDDKAFDEKAKQFVHHLYEGSDIINPPTMDGSKHLENGLVYAKDRPSVIKGLAMQKEEYLIKVFPKEIIKLFKQQTIHSSRYGILEVYTRQILINYIGQVFEGPVRIVIYTNSTSVEGNQIELLVEMYQTSASKEKLSNRMIVTLGKPISATVIKESLKEFTFLQRKEKYDLVNLSYNSQGNMTIAAILDNLQNELGLAMEWITGVFFYRMKVVLKKAIMVRRAHYLFTGTPIREPWNKKGFIIDTYVKSGYKDAGIRLEFLQVIYRERTIKGNKILSLVGVGFREIVFVDLKSKRPVSMQFASLEDILRLQKKKKKEAEQRLRVQESVEKALKLKPKGFWEAIWPETWLKSWFKKE